MQNGHELVQPISPENQISNQKSKRCVRCVLYSDKKTGIDHGLDSKPDSPLDMMIYQTILIIPDAMHCISNGDNIARKYIK
jgi:hypothetical protein